MNGTLTDIQVPFPPTLNHYLTTVRIKGKTRKILSQKARTWREDARYTIKMNLPPGWEPIEEGVAVALMVCPPAKPNRRRDIDNYVKPVLDAMKQAGVYADDSQVHWLTVFRGEPVDGGCVWIRNVQQVDTRNVFLSRLWSLIRRFFSARSNGSNGTGDDTD